jgi:repressor LexA
LTPRLDRGILLTVSGIIVYDSWKDIMQHKKEEYFNKISEYIENYWHRYGVSPTTRAIADGTDLSNSTVSRYLQYMRDKGMIDYRGHRSLRTKRQIAGDAGRTSVPLLGAVACGVPKLAEENIEEYVDLPVSLFGRGSFYLLRADGKSMINAGIGPGDLVLVRAQDTAEPGQIVVALMDTEATLKRYFPEPEKKRVRLHPENDSMEDIYVPSCEIQGVAVKVIKDLH